jgi:metallophosphoesterase (TIGR00282 family)
MRVLFIGDVVGKPGRALLCRRLPRIVDERGVAFVTANAENLAGGVGATPETCDELFAAGVDCLTSGNHIWDKKEIIPYLNREPRLLRPANYPESNPGTGVYLGTSRDGVRVAVASVMGRVFLVNVDCPFRTMDAILAEIRGQADCVIVDMHAEATSEKVAMGWYLDGRVSAVVGTHTHIPTADERILPKGTAYLTDVGMTGPFDSVIGVEKELVLERFLTQRHVRMQPAEGDPRLHGVLIDIDPATGRAVGIERIAMKE